MVFLYIIAALIVFIILLTAAEIIKLKNIKTARELPDADKAEYFRGIINGKTFEDLYLFLSGQREDIFFSEDEVYSSLSVQCEYMNNRFDCSDFKAQLLFKIYKDCKNKLSDRCKELIKNTFLSFKYFMDEPGRDSMCYWSENHQILFAVSEYLAGQEWQNEIFTNSGLTGKEHLIKARKRIEAWMHQRFNYGFSEYLSNNYLAEDIAPMANFINYCEDKTLAEQMKIITDVLWLDVALNCSGNRFVAVSSRMYGNNKAGNYLGNSIKAAINILWGEESCRQKLCDPDLSDKEKTLIEDCLNTKPNHIVLCFTDIVKKGIYTLPEAIHDAALYNEEFISKMGCGLSPEDLKNEGLIGQKPYQIMAQMGAETFTNHQVIDNTLIYLKNNNMFTNSFLAYFRYLTLTVLKPLNFEKLTRKYNIMPHGIATGRGNVYTYRTSRYTLSTDICKDVDMCGAQGHCWTANISENLTLFTTHPAGNGNGRFTSSPGYWIGDGRRPMSVQHRNVNITIYKLPEKKRFGESAVSDITHAYMPECFYDEFIKKENAVFARKNGVFAAFISNGELFFKPFDNESLKGIYKSIVPAKDFSISGNFDLCRQGGKYHCYVTEMSQAETESFGDFIKRIEGNILHFEDNGKVTYKTQNGEISVSYNGEFSVNGKPQQKEFLRYDSIFCTAERKAESIFINTKKHSLHLNLKNVIRQEN